MNKVIEILMKRDGFSKSEAESQLAECREAIYEAMEYGDDPEDIIADYLGLEPDYIFDII